MYRSVLLVNVGADPDRPRPGRLWLRNRYRVHQRLCMAFPSSDRRSSDVHFLAPYRPGDFGDWVPGKDGKPVHAPRTSGSGFLFRVEPVPPGRAVILVQSSRRPDWEYAFHNAEYLLAAPPEVKELHWQYGEGDRLRFCLQANATRKVTAKTGDLSKRKNGTRVPVRREDLAGWLHRKGEESGFRVDEAELRIETGYVCFYKDKTADREEQGRLFSVVYGGTLRVTDASLFARALEAGIGPAKGFGFGLLTVSALPE